MIIVVLLSYIKDKIHICLIDLSVEWGPNLCIIFVSVIISKFCLISKTTKFIEKCLLIPCAIMCTQIIKGCKLCKNLCFTKFWRLIRNLTCLWMKPEVQIVKTFKILKHLQVYGIQCLQCRPEAHKIWLISCHHNSMESQHNWYIPTNLSKFPLKNQWNLLQIILFHHGP